MTNFRKGVEKALAKKGITKTEVTTKLKISTPGFYNKINGNPTLKSIDGIAKVLGMKTSELIALGE